MTPGWPALDLSALAEEPGGYSASDVEFLVDQAARYAMDRDQDISHESFRAAMTGFKPSVTPEIEEQYRSIEERGS